MSTRITHVVTFCYGCRGMRRLLIRLCFPVAVVLLVILISALNAFGGQYKLVSYGEAGAVEPRYRTVDGDTGWSAELSALSIDGVVQWSVLRACPKRHEAILGVVDMNRHLNVQTWDGTVWSNLLELVDNFPSGDSRFFDIAYESQSGNAMVVYGVNGSKNPRYRIWDGNSWSAENTIPLPGGGDHEQLWIWLVPDPNSDEIVMVGQTDDRKLYASVWDGNSWGDALGEFDKSRTNDFLCLDACREGQSGDVLVVWAPDKGRKLEYIVWNGLSWGEKQKTGDLPDGVQPWMIKMTSDPGSDEIMVGIADDKGALGAARWYGSDLGSFEKLTDNCRVTGKSRGWDLMYESESGNCLLVYNEVDHHDLRYRIYDGVWGNERIGPDLSNLINVLQLQRNGFNSDNRIFLLSLTDDEHIESLLWDGIEFLFPYEMEFGASSMIYEPLASVYIEDCAPIVSVLSPDGSEIVAVWDTVEIRWSAITACGIDSMTIEFSSDAGSTWSLISSGEPNDSVCLWVVPPTPSESCLVAIIAYGTVGASTRDESDDFFTIADLTPPDVSVAFPNGGETFLAGDTCVISWTASDDVGVTHVDVYYSTTGGFDWDTVSVGEGNDFQYEWVVPATPSEMCLVKIKAFDAALNMSFDVSDSLFTIYDQTGVVEGFRRGAIPREFQLLQNEPNPFRTSTVIKLLSPTDGSISLSIYDCAGRLIKRLGGEAEPGVVRLVWDGRDSSGHLVPAGVYVCHLHVESSEGIFEGTKKMMVVK